MEQLVRQHTPPTASAPADGQGLLSSPLPTALALLFGSLLGWLSVPSIPQPAESSAHLRRSLDVFVRNKRGHRGSYSWLSHAKYLESGQRDENTLPFPLLTLVTRASAVFPGTERVSTLPAQSVPEDGQAPLCSPPSLHTNGATQGCPTQRIHSKAKQVAKEMGQLHIFQLLEKEMDEMGKLNT